MKTTSTCYTMLMFVVILATFLLVGCSCKDDDQYSSHLNSLHTLIDKNPEAALDSLKKIKKKDISKFNGIYYELLWIIALDKSYYNFTSDSSINSVVKDAYPFNNSHPRLYARSLMYQGIIRYRMGIIDKTAYEPLKQAANIFKLRKSENLDDLYLCYFYLGIINYKNNNLELSNNYLEDALTLAGEIGNNDYLFNATWNLFRNAMGSKDYNAALGFLQTLDKWKESDKFATDVSNAYASYYKSQKQYKNALEVEYKQLKDKVILKDSSLLSAVYYRISEDYQMLNNADSALKYAEFAIKYTTDTVNYRNFFYFQRIADNAMALGYWEKGALAYQKSFNMLNQSIRRRMDTNVLELEKKYDLSEAKNKRLVAEKRSYVFLAVATILLTIIVYFYFYYRQKLIQEKLEKKTVEQELVIQNHKLEQATKDANIKRWVNELYQYVIERDKKLQTLLYRLENNKLFKQDEKLLLLLTQTIEEYKKEMKESSIKLLDEDMFHQFTGLNYEDAHVLLDSEKLLLVLMVNGMNNKQIASLVGSSTESIRKRRTYLIEKLKENHIYFEDI